MDGVEKRLAITGDNFEYVRKYFGEPEDLTDKDAVKIVEELGEFNSSHDEIEDAWWSDTEEIVYWVNEHEWDNTPDPMDIAKERMLEAGFNTYCY